MWVGEYPSFIYILYTNYKMTYIKKDNLTGNDQYVRFDPVTNRILSKKRDQGIHSSMISGVFKVSHIRKGMTINGVHITGINKKKNSEFVVIKKNALGKNVPSNDIIVSPGQKIRINDNDKKAESLIDGEKINKVYLPQTTTYHFLSDKKEYICIYNLLIVCSNNNKYGENLNNEMKFI